MPTVDAFLPDPRAIRRAIRAALVGSSALDMAVAFVGKDWSDILGDFKRRTRCVCWLSSTNTNPYAVEQLIQRTACRVRQVDVMHAKVYVPRAAPAVAIVGSANLSTSALSDEEPSGQFEAAILVRHRSTVREISRWFETLWSNARPITHANLVEAKAAWESARRMRAGGTGGPKSKRAITGLPPGWRPSSKLRALARHIRGEDPHSHGDALLHQRFFSSLQPTRLNKQGLQEAIQHVTEWTGHPGAFRPALSVPISRVRGIFAYAFDESVDVVERLEQLGPHGPFKLDGFGINAWTLVLSWRNPRDCVPLNARTFTFLKGLGLQRLVGATATPAGYRRWRSLARDLQQRLQLPTLAHVDRMVSRFRSG